MLKYYLNFHLSFEFLMSFGVSFDCLRLPMDCGRCSDSNVGYHRAFNYVFDAVPKHSLLRRMWCLHFIRRHFVCLSREFCCTSNAVGHLRGG